MKIKLYVVGKKNSSYQIFINDYIKKINHSLDITFTLINPSGLSGKLARQKDSENIIQRLCDIDTLWLLDETGSQLSSPELAHIIENQNNKSKNLSIVIGGAYGVSDDLKKQADFIWSLSKLVLPHELAWVVVAEQLYRATQINKNSNYHHA